MQKSLPVILSFLGLLTAGSLLAGTAAVSHTAPVMPALIRFQPANPDLPGGPEPAMEWPRPSQFQQAGPVLMPHVDCEIGNHDPCVDDPEWGDSGGTCIQNHHCDCGSIECHGNCVQSERGGCKYNSANTCSGCK